MSNPAAVQADLYAHGISQSNIQNGILEGDLIGANLSTDPSVAVRQVQRYATYLHLEQGDMAHEYRAIEEQLSTDLQAHEQQFAHSIQAQKQRFNKALATQEKRFDDALKAQKKSFDEALNNQREASRTLERTVHDLEANLARLTTHCISLDGKVQASEHQRLKMEAIMRIQLDKIGLEDWKSFGNSAIEDRRFQDISQKVETNKGAMVKPAHPTASTMPPPRAMPRRPPTAVRAAFVAGMPAAAAAAQSSSSAARPISMRPASSSSSSS